MYQNHQSDLLRYLLPLDMNPLGNKMKIGFDISYFMRWMGGRQFISNIIKSLNSCLSLDVSVGIKATQSGCDRVLISKLSPDKHQQIISLCEAAGVSEISIFDDVDNWISSEQIDVLGPTFNITKVSIPSISYIPDFQHKYYPQYFDEKELSIREIQYAQTLKNAPNCLVGDKSVAEDIARFYPWATTNLFVLPPLLTFADQNITNVSSFITTQEISHDYLIVCSQRWQHKRHDLVLNAFSHYMEKSVNNQLKNRFLVFTGDKTDYRSNDTNQLFQNLINDLHLNDHVADLGRIDRNQQLALIKNATALVTASEFEGGFEASGVGEALILGTPVIANNTEIYSQNYPMPISLCDFSNPISSASVFADAFDKKLDKAFGQADAKSLYEKSTQDLINIFHAVSRIPPN